MKFISKGKLPRYDKIDETPQAIVFLLGVPTKPTRIALVFDAIAVLFKKLTLYNLECDGRFLFPVITTYHSRHINMFVYLYEPMDNCKTHHEGGTTVSNTKFPSVLNAKGKEGLL